jgi:hypothetical protein
VALRIGDAVGGHGSILLNGLVTCPSSVGLGVRLRRGLPYSCVRL